MKRGLAGRVSIRQTSLGPEFYDTATGRRFVPRGNNYIRLAWVADPWGGHNFGHSLFHPGFYDAACANQAIMRMAEAGFNVVRVFISEIGVGNGERAGVHPEYMRNVADFLRLAEANAMRVHIAFWSLPRVGGYQPLTLPPQELEGINAYYLHQVSIEGKKRFVRDFVGALKAEGAPLDTVFAWELDNEAHYMENQRPLSLSTGLITVANGQTYDMAIADDRQAMMDAGFVYWADQVTSAVKENDPSGLVTMSFFSPAAVIGNDPRITRTKPLIEDQERGGPKLDFVSLHMYPGFHPMRDELAAFEIVPSRKPLLMGEMGMFFNSVVPPKASKVAEVLRLLQELSCAPEYRFAGWLLYTWDTTESADGRRDLFTGLDDGGKIRDALSPQKVPDACGQRTAQLQ